MRAMVCHSLTHDRSGLRFESSWSEPSPPQAAEVTVALAYAALNYPDVLMLSGGYQFAPALPFIPGVEGAGTIVAVGEGVDVTQLNQRVIVGVRQGCFAERITVPLSAIRPVPPRLDLAAAAGLTVGALTAYVGLVRRGRLAAGERVVVAGAGGGTGLAAVAVAKALGATVTALASTGTKLAAARAAGADELVLVERGEPVPPLAPNDIVFDPVGGGMVAPLLATLRRGGRYLVIGFVGGIEAVGFDKLEGIEVIGVRAGEFARRNPAAGVANLAAVDALVAQLTPIIGLRVPLSAAATAYAAMTGGTLIGKAIIDCGGVAGTG